MKIIIAEDANILGKKAAAEAARALNRKVKKYGRARLLLSTGKSQLEVLQFLIKEKVNWTKIEMFHLDEYVGVSDSHRASFRRYLNERFVAHLHLAEAYMINGEKNVAKTISSLEDAIGKAPIDVALVGIGINTHIAFNDPPADFETKKPFIKVKLDQVCKQQQVDEGWFTSIEEIPEEAITMSVHQIMKSEKIISCVPSISKVEAVLRTLNEPISNKYPSTILKSHPRWSLYLDKDSASGIIK